MIALTETDDTKSSCDLESHSNFFMLFPRFGCIKDRQLPHPCHAVLHIVNGKPEAKVGHTCDRDEHETPEQVEFRRLFVEACKAPGAGKPKKVFDQVKAR